jgi:hypothetical protein
MGNLKERLKKSDNIFVKFTVKASKTILNLARNLKIKIKRIIYRLFWIFPIISIS